MKPRLAATGRSRSGVMLLNLPRSYAVAVDQLLTWLGWRTISVTETVSEVLSWVVIHRLYRSYCTGGEKTFVTRNDYAARSSH